MMKNKVQFLHEAVCKFNNDENGMETMQVVMILAIAAIAGVAVYAIGKNLVSWGNEKVTEVTGSEAYDVPAR